jgi:hypothetical protein
MRNLVFSPPVLEFTILFEGSAKRLRHDMFAPALGKSAIFVKNLAHPHLHPNA